MAEPQQTSVRPFHIMVKPIGSRCNLDCTYCEYLRGPVAAGHAAPSHVEQGSGGGYCRASSKQDADTVQFSWHGGEPTLLGFYVFRRAIELEQKYEGGKRSRKRFADQWFVAGLFVVPVSWGARFPGGPERRRPEAPARSFSINAGRRVFLRSDLPGRRGSSSGTTLRSIP